MLKVFRDNLKYLSWVLWLVILVFVLFMAVEYRGVGAAGAPTESAATVDGEPISYGELQRAYRQAEEAYRDAYGAQFTPELARQLQLPLQVLEQLVQQRLMLAEAERMGLMVSDAELQRELLELPVFQDDQGRFIGAEQYRRVVRQLGYGSPEAFENEFRQQLLLSKINQILAENMIITDAEIEAAYRAEAERAKIRYVRLPASRFQDRVSPTDEEVASYFETDPEAFRLPERRAVDYLVVDVDAIRRGLEITDEELQEYYRANLEDYTTEEQVRARQILIQVNDERSDEKAQQVIAAIQERLAAGESFAELAVELSEDPVSAPQGGDLGFFGRGQILEEVEQAAFEAEPGEVVGPVRSTFGYHLIEVVEHTPGGVPAFAEMEDAVRRRVLAERARETAERRAAELADSLQRGGTTEGTLQGLAVEDPTLIFESTDPFGRNDNVPGIGRATPFSATAFSLEEGAASDPVRIGAGWAILRLREVVPPRLPELDEVQDEVRAALVASRAEENALERLEEARREIAAGASLEDVAEALDVEVEESSEFARGGSIGGSLGSAPEIQAAALTLDEGEVGQPAVVGGAAVLFEVVERHRFDPAELAERRESIREQLAAEQLNGLLSSLLRERREELEVSYDPGLIDNLGLEG